MIPITSRFLVGMVVVGSGANFKQIIFTTVVMVVVDVVGDSGGGGIGIIGGSSSGGMHHCVSSTTSMCSSVEYLELSSTIDRESA